MAMTMSGPWVRTGHGFDVLGVTGEHRPQLGLQAVLDVGLVPRGYVHRAGARFEVQVAAERARHVGRFHARRTVSRAVSGALEEHAVRQGGREVAV
jgi:hypothetical protein